MEKFQIAYSVRGCCIVNVPESISHTNEDITEFIVDKICLSELENWVDTWVDFEVTEVSIDE